MRKSWNRDRVIEAIRRRHQRGLIDELRDRHRAGHPLICTWPANRFLAGTAKRHFGGWHKALRAAGLTPEVPTRTTKKKVGKG